MEAAALHPAHRHSPRAADDHGGWVGVDRGLTAFAVAATTDGIEVARIGAPPRPLRAAMARQRRLAKCLARRKRGSRRHQRDLLRLQRHHHRIANIRRHFLHDISNALVKTHDRLVIEDLNVTGMIANHRIAQAISDAGWSEFARMLRYKMSWRGGEITLASRYFPSTKTCAACGAIRANLPLTDRVFRCGCGYTADRDHNAAGQSGALG